VKDAGGSAVLESAVTECTGSPFLTEITLPGQPASAGVARRFVLDALADCPRADDLALAVSELATNAVAWSAAGHGDGGAFTVRVRTAPRWARIEVTDPGPAAARSAAPGNGWGLAIVAAVTDRAGATAGPGPARTAWAEVTWPPGRKQTVS